jgi:hypothetical protein
MADVAERAADEVIKVPAGLMGLLRQSYDTREKVLDWMLSFAVVWVMVILFRQQLTEAWGQRDLGPNVGREDSLVPNQNLASMIGAADDIPPGIYTYNMPSSRMLKHSRGPSGTRVPTDPSATPVYPE